MKSGCSRGGGSVGTHDSKGNPEHHEHKSFRDNQPSKISLRDAPSAFQNS